MITMNFTLQKVLISDEIDAKCVNIFRENGIEVVKNTKLTKDQLLEEIKNFDALVVRSATKVSADVIEAGTRLKVIGRAGTGVDNIDCEAATKRGVLVMNTPAGNTISAAEHTCALICCLSRHIAQARASMSEARWDRKKFMGSELMGKTLAILGLGRIGREVAVRMQAFGMRTIGFDPIIPADEAAKFNVLSLALEAIWPQADYITVHTPLIPQTRNLINADVLSKCKPSVRIVNVARGGIIDEEALLEALKKGRCGGAGLDVFDEEPPANFELARHPLVVATPHLGASTVEAQARVAAEIAEQMVALSAGCGLSGAVNGAVLNAALRPQAGPWLQLASLLASAVEWQKHSGKAELQVTLRSPEKSPVRGLVRCLEAQLACAGLGSGSYNLVSGPAVAAERGVRVRIGWKSAEAASLELAVGGAAVSGAVREAEPVLTHIGGAELRQPVRLLGAGRWLTLVKGPLGCVLAALNGKNAALHCLTTSCDGATSVLVADQPLNRADAVSFRL